MSRPPAPSSVCQWPLLPPPTITTIATNTIIFRVATRHIFQTKTFSTPESKHFQFETNRALIHAKYTRSACDESDDMHKCTEVPDDFDSKPGTGRAEADKRSGNSARAKFNGWKQRICFRELQHWRDRKDMAGPSLETLLFRRLCLLQHDWCHCSWGMEWHEWPHQRPVINYDTQYY